MSASPFATSIVVLTARHSIAGVAALHERRLSDYLNERKESFIVLRETQITRLSEPTKIIQQQAEAIIPKSRAIVVFEPPQKGASIGTRFYSYVRKDKYPVFLILESMEVQGILHTQGPLELRRLLATTSDSFLPVTQATVYLSINERFVIRQDAIMVNTQVIRYIGQTQTPPT